MEIKNIVFGLIILILIGLVINNNYQQRNWSGEWLCLPSGWVPVNSENLNQTNGCQLFYAL